MNTLTEIALTWLNLGIAPIPCYYKSKHPSIAWQRYQTTLPTEQQVRYWFAGTHANLAIICGWQGLVVVDFDSFDAYELWLSWYVDNPAPPTEQPIFDSTLRVITNRGVHLYLMVDEPVATLHIRKILDIKASRGDYIVTPPSIHPSGRHYKSNDLPVLRVPTLQGILPSEWISRCSVGGQRQAPVAFSINPLQRIDQVQASLIETLRSRFVIQDFIKDAIQTRDGWLVARCPFHDDHDPSFWIDTRKQLCGCYAGCNSKPMDVINLFGKLNGLSNGEAIVALMRGL